MAFSKIKADATELDLATQAEIDLKSPLASPTFTGTVAGVTKAHVGLSNVDNTTDALKPVSTATAASFASIRQDLTILALREAVTENRVANNLPNSFIDQFQDDTGVGPTSGAGSVGNTIFRNASDECLTPQDIWSTPDWVTTTRTDVAITTGIGWQNDGTDYATMEGNWFNYSGSYFTAIGPTGADIYPMSPFTDANVLTMYFGGSFANRISGYRFSGTGTQGASTSIEGYIQGSDSISSGYVTLSALINSSNAGGGTSFLSLPTSVTTTQEITWTNTTVYQYIKFQKTSGTLNSSGSWFGFQFRESTPPAAFPSGGDGVIISKTTADTSVKTKVSGVLLYKDAYGTATFGSASGDDLEILFTCDGTNYTTAASYTPVTPVFSTGIKMLKLGETTCTNAGSSSVIGYKAVWKNQASGSLVTELHGIGLNY